MLCQIYQAGTLENEMMEGRSRKNVLEEKLRVMLSKVLTLEGLKS